MTGATKWLVVAATVVVGLWLLRGRVSFSFGNGVQLAARGPVQRLTGQPMSDSGTQELPARMSVARRMAPTAGLLRPVPIFSQKVAAQGGVPIA